MHALGFSVKEEAVLETLTEDVLKSSEIEGEILDKDQVRSSIARRLGMDVGALAPADRNVEGIVESGSADVVFGHPLHPYSRGLLAAVRESAEFAFSCVV